MSRKGSSKGENTNRGRPGKAPSVSMQCPNKGCGTTITAETNGMLGVKFSQHLDSCKFGDV